MKCNLGEGKNNFRYKQDRDWCNEHVSGILLTPKETHEAFFLAHLACEDGKPQLNYRFGEYFKALTAHVRSLQK